jgi:Flp pilus assembly protein TadG
MKTNKNVETSHSERGQSIVEFGVGMVVLIILLAGIVDGGRALFTYMAIREAAQEGALFGSTDPTQTSMIVSRAENASDLIRDRCQGRDSRRCLCGQWDSGHGYLRSISNYHAIFRRSTGAPDHWHKRFSY